jgi:hypothetical protein
MGRRSRLFFLLFVLVLVFFSPSSGFSAEASKKPELETLLNQIEYRHYRWVALRADVVLFFVSPGNVNQGMCGGELLYHRLDERMLLTCYDAEKNLVFAFRTLDRRFDLYIPSQNTLYHGSIFDLEDSPEVESHLKLIDLYRALKPGMFDPRRTEVSATSDIKISLDVFGGGGGEKYLSRKAYVTPSGDVVGELFFSLEGQTLTEIQRHDFQEINERVGSFTSIFFPKKITIVSPSTGKNTAIFFSKVKPLDAIETAQFLLRVRKGTQEVFLKERDPRFTRMAIEAAKNKYLEKNPARKMLGSEENPEPLEEAAAENPPAVVEGAPYDPAALTELPGSPAVTTPAGTAAAETAPAAPEDTAADADIAPQ